MDKQSILNKIDVQRQFLAQNGMNNYKNRVETLKRLYKNIKLMTPEINEALKQDLNKSAEETYMTEIGLTLNEISYMVKNCKRLSSKRRVGTPLSQIGRAHV